jgi:MFS family permease
MSNAQPNTHAMSGVVSTLLPIMTIVLIAFSIIGLALPVLPLYVNQDLGLGTFVVGLVTGSQFAASLVSRVWAGRYADSYGAKRAVVIGLVTAVASGGLYLLSLHFRTSPALSVSVLIMGRALLGAAESFIITGALGWGLVLVDHRHAGKVIAWVGMAMFAAFALGAPAGSLLFDHFGFISIALATAGVPLIALLVVAPVRAVNVQPKNPQRMSQVIGAVWVPGLGLAFSSIGFGAITAFIALLFTEKGWSLLWLAFTAFAVAFILARVFFGHLPDKLGGAKVAFVFALIEAAGLILIWLAPVTEVALAGALLTGAGYSLVFPGLGVEAIRRVPTQNRALAMGTYTAFLDLALGVTTPALGLIASWDTLGTVFLISAALALGCAGISVQLVRRSAFVSS